MAIFIHTSDWHIGNSFVHFDPETGKKLNRARLTAVESILIYARMKKIFLILCAGDAVDNGQLAPDKNLLDLFAVIKKYPEIKVILIAGNHDPLMANSVYLRVSESNYPPNLHLVRKSEIIPLESLNLTVYAASTLEKNGSQNPLHWINAGHMDAGKINIGLAHGSIKNEKFSGDAFPIEPDFAREKKLDYLALGDWHSYVKINERTYYCGVPEPLQFGDDGCPLQVTIDKPGAVPKIEKIIGVQQYTWTEQHVELTDSRFPGFKEILETTSEKEIKKLTVTGFLTAENYKTYKELLHLNRSRYYRIEDRVSIAPDPDQLIGVGDGHIKAIVQRLLELKDSDAPIPDEILTGVIPADQLSIEPLTQTTKNEIIDCALMKLYKHFCANISGPK
jgi:DNA repair exonuclease SbcCD nuclease subunit